MSETGSLDWTKDNFIKVRDDDIPIKLEWEKANPSHFKADESAPAWYKNKKDENDQSFITINDLRSLVQNRSR